MEFWEEIWVFPLDFPIYSDLFFPLVFRHEIETLWNVHLFFTKITLFVALVLWVAYNCINYIIRIRNQMDTNGWRTETTEHVDAPRLWPFLSEWGAREGWKQSQLVGEEEAGWDESIIDLIVIGLFASTGTFKVLDLHLWLCWSICASFSDIKFFLMWSFICRVL